MMTNDISLKEFIEKSQQEEAQKKYEKNVAPMKADIDEFVDKLKNYCLSNKTMEVRIIYKVKYESSIGFFGIPLRGNQISSLIHSELDDAWTKLLTKWYFTKNGSDLIYAVQQIASENGFLSTYNEDGWGWNRSMIQFTLK